MALVKATDALVAEAGSTVDVERLRELSQHRLTAVRTAVAKNPSTPIDVLVDLVGDRHHLPRYGVAENPGSVSVQVVLEAADSSVRAILAQRRDLDAPTYEALLADPDKDVRENLVWSTDRPDFLQRLAADPHRSVRGSVPHRDICSTN
ncbi:MAG: hypothetical protein WC642_05180 [Nocardioides sp.]|jgi:hypothetical protein